MQSNAGRGDQRPQSSGDPALCPNHFTHIVRGDLEFEHITLNLADRHLIGFVDQRLRDLLDQSSHVAALLAHLQFLSVGWKFYWHARQNQAAGTTLGAGLATILPTRSDILAPLDTQ